MFPVHCVYGVTFTPCVIFRSKPNIERIYREYEGNADVEDELSGQVNHSVLTWF